MNKCYVLVRSINEYNQDGEYFVAVFKNKPSKEELNKVLECNNNEEYLQHIINGGGRIGKEHEWYDLIEIDFGESYE